jgi:hypothetical protein
LGIIKKFSKSTGNSGKPEDFHRRIQESRRISIGKLGKPENFHRGILKN